MLLNNKNMSIFSVCMKTAGFDQTLFHMLKHYLALRSMASATAIQTAWRRYICASNWPLYKQKLQIQERISSWPSHTHKYARFNLRPADLGKRIICTFQPNGEILEATLVSVTYGGYPKEWWVAFTDAKYRKSKLAPLTDNAAGLLECFQLCESDMKEWVLRRE